MRLIADLIERKGIDAVLPQNRLGLYQLILETIQAVDGSTYPEDRLCRAAWVIWRDGERKLKINEHLDADLLTPLYEEGQRVLRALEGNRYEFRHDQMRAYLAARWAAVHETNPQRLFTEEAKIWRLSRRDQEEVWDFFAEMIISEPEKAISLWKWATEDQ